MLTISPDFFIIFPTSWSRIYFSYTSCWYLKVDFSQLSWEGCTLFNCWSAVKRLKRKKREREDERTCVFLWLTCRRVWVRVLFQTDVFPQCISYVVHTLLAAKGQSIEWRRKHAETAYTVITLNLFIGHFVFFCLCQVCCDINNGTTGIDNDVCQF